MLTRLIPFVALFAVVASLNAAAAATSPVEIGTITGVRDLGRAPASLRVRVAVVLRYRQDAELGSLTQAQADPASPLYHHFLSPAQFAAYFAPTPADYGRVVSSLQRGGFTITHVFSNRTVVDAVAAAPVAANYFRTDIHQVQT